MNTDPRAKLSGAHPQLWNAVRGAIRMFMHDHPEAIAALTTGQLDGLTKRIVGHVNSLQGECRQASPADESGAGAARMSSRTGGASLAPRRCPGHLGAGAEQRTGAATPVRTGAK